jgi:hypothetical protein
MSGNRIPRYPGRWYVVDQDSRVTDPEPSSSDIISQTADQPAVNRILYDEEHPSRLILPINEP